MRQGVEGDRKAMGREGGGTGKRVRNEIILELDMNIKVTQGRKQRILGSGESGTIHNTKGILFL